MPELPRRSYGELRKAALAAEAYVRIDAARQYGFIEGGPTINVERCEEVIVEAAAAGIVYHEAEINQAAVELIAWENATPAERAAALGEDGHDA